MRRRRRGAWLGAACAAAIAAVACGAYHGASDAGRVFACGPAIGAKCQVGAQACCGYEPDYAHRPDTYGCVDAGSSCKAAPNGLYIECTSNADCVAAGVPQGVCCASHSCKRADCTALEVRCVSGLAACPEPNKGVMCDTTAPDCPAGTTCKPGGFALADYAECL